MGRTDEEGKPATVHRVSTSQLEVGYLLKWRMAIKGMQFTFIRATLVRIFVRGDASSA